MTNRTGAGVVSADVDDALRIALSNAIAAFPGMLHSEKIDAVLAAVTPLIRERCAKACDARVAAHRARMSEYPLDRVACNADALEAGKCAAAIRGGG